MKNNIDVNNIQRRGLNLRAFTIIAILIFGFNANGQTAGNLDPTFNNNGRRVTDVGGQSEGAWAVVSQPDGKNIAVGATDSAMTLIRYEANGALDAIFGTGGIVSYNAGGSGGMEAVLQLDGKILVGTTVPSGAPFDSDFAVLRFNSNGAIDPTFGTNGIVKAGFGYTEENPTGMLLQLDGKIVLAGYSRNGDINYDICIARFDSNGILDATFDGDGKVITDIFGESTVDIIEGIAIQPDGKLVVAGGRNTSATFRDAMLVRYNADGSLDASFDGDGIRFYDFVTGNNDQATDVAIQPNGKILISATAPDSFNTFLALARFNSDGNLDNSFDGDGVRVTTYVSSPSRILLQPVGNIIVLGNSINNGFSLFRFKPDGSNETTFGSGGARQSVRFGTITNGRAVSLQPDSKIVVAGSDRTGANENFFAARFTALEPTAALVTVSGRVLSPFGRGVFGATVRLTDQQGNTRQTNTNPFGYYQFESVQAGNTYVFSAFSKRYSFEQRVISVNEEITDLNFAAENGGKVTAYEN